MLFFYQLCSQNEKGTYCNCGVNSKSGQIQNSELSTEDKNYTENRIHGGVPASIGEYPWQVGLVKKCGMGNYKAYQCGGTLISRKHVMTAAHCIDDGNKPRLKMARELYHIVRN
jgi:secreted trypsin-like serine protease